MVSAPCGFQILEAENLYPRRTKSLEQKAQNSPFMWGKVPDFPDWQPTLHSAKLNRWKFGLIFNFLSLGRSTVFEVSVVQNLCRAIAVEKDPGRTASLLQALREVMKDQQEEFRFRLLYVARQCAVNLAETRDSSRRTQVGDSSAEEDGGCTISYGHPYQQGRKSLFGSVCLTLLREEFKPEEL